MPYSVYCLERFNFPVVLLSSFYKFVSGCLFWQFVTAVTLVCIYELSGSSSFGMLACLVVTRVY